MIRADLPEAIARLEAGTYSGKLGYAVARTLLELRRLGRELQAQREDAYSPEVRAYMQRRQALVWAHAQRDDQGEPIVDAGRVRLRPSYDEALAALEASDSAHERWQQEERALLAYLREDVAVSRRAVDEADIPADRSGYELAILFDLFEVRE